MYEAIKNFPKQFEYEPRIENGRKLKKYFKFIVAGMGGSNLVPELLKIRDPYLDIFSHRDYGLPALKNGILRKSLVIASSYSGNTEETIDAFLKAVKSKFPVAAVSVGGKLLELARKYKKPYIQFPNAGIQPRLALGFNARALLLLLGNRNFYQESGELAEFLKSYELEWAGKALARRLRGQMPLIYSSLRNQGITYNWKIKFNETGKIPAFYNTFPELNHNEMTGFSAGGACPSVRRGSAFSGDAQSEIKKLSKNFYFLFLKDFADHPKIAKRMNITERLYRERGLAGEVLFLNGKSVFHKIFSSLLLADWAAYYTAKEYGVEVEQVPMVEEFKKLIK